ncbi:MAG: aminotransferase class III-fold pyridoxal phosphate-dependent enzyme [Candidatus Margulisbacteria bacterium]|nr:aminotransferase class III-fold pyridoxal phosphate-dependent enzyme [Candidatus Margulisiibacteriota bacterium]MBU1617124.1 aminotransferase class III-fold pyridoxal phosphate-dependent enzyme [Candidatus Margulisiibacteriota bacterium]
MGYEKSLKLYDEAINLIPSATQTFSKGARQYPFGAAPIFLAKGKGSHVWDVDGNEFIDYPMALGAIILGHSYPSVNRAIMQQLEKGIVYSLPHPLEVELAEILVEIIPCAEMVRFGKNGSDATAGAVRTARAYTGRDKVACCGYHGWQDWYIGTTTRNAGVPGAVQDLTLTFTYNDIDSLKKVFDENKGQIAAVIMEPVGIVEPKNRFLQQVKELAHKNGALLIFDEVVTGFRMGLGGAQQYFNVIPDMACIGKAMANGLPISCVVGRKEIMETFDEVFFSFTFGGECLSLAAAIATISEMMKKNVIKKIWANGKKLQEGYNCLAQEMNLGHITQCAGLPPHTVITYDNLGEIDPLLIRTLFQQEAIKRGVLAIGVHNVCYSHSSEDIDKTLKAYRGTLQVINEALADGDIKRFLKGKVVRPVFRKP